MKSKTELSAWQQHKEQWGYGCGATLCGGAKHIVLAKGKLPCDILFIGEAPGESEDVIGLPFVGPAGKLLDHIVRLSGCDKFRLAYTNMVGCIPREDNGRKATEPDDDSIRYCSPRLEQFISIARPRLIVCVGALSAGWLDKGYKHSIKVHVEPTPAIIKIAHPAAILRASIAHKGLMVQREVVTLSSAVEDLQ